MLNLSLLVKALKCEEGVSEAVMEILRPMIAKEHPVVYDYVLATDGRYYLPADFYLCPCCVHPTTADGDSPPDRHECTCPGCGVDFEIPLL